MRRSLLRARPLRMPVRRALGAAISRSPISPARALMGASTRIPCRQLGTNTAADNICLAEELLNKNKFISVRERLQADPRFRLTWAEFEDMCAAADITPEEAKAFCGALHGAGVVVQLPMAPFVYLKPKAITRELLRLLDPDGTISRLLVAQRASNLEAMESELVTLTKRKEELEKLATAHARRAGWMYMGGVCVQACILARLIWWDLSWDVMEPVTYLMGFSYMTAGWAWFTLSRDDLGNYESLGERLRRKKLTKLMESNGFDINAYNDLVSTVAQKRRQLESFGVHATQDRYPLPCDHLRPDEIAAADESALSEEPDPIALKQQPSPA